MIRTLAPFALIAAFAAVAALLSAEAPMADLLATWLAGHFYGAGELGQVYPAEGPLYTMRPPSDWPALMAARGYDHVIFPFVYPPLWAAAAAPLAGMLGPEGLFAVARVLNPLLIGLMVWLAGRAVRSPLPPALYLAIGLALAAGTKTGQLALVYGQPQILVAFLTVLAIERSQRGGPFAAGAALALAAALKVYPALYALAWAVAGRWRLALAFAGAGLALGLLSVAVAGWPLHRDFLALLGAIGDTVLVTSYTYSIDPVVVQLAFPEGLFFVPQAPGSEIGWFIAAKGPLWSALSCGATGAVLVAGGAVLRRTGDPLVWPLVMILCSLLAPLAWVYQYLAPMAFAPALIHRLGRRTGPLWLIVCVTPLLLPVVGVLDGLSPSPLPLQIVSTLCFAGLAGGFGLAIARGRP